MTYHQNGCHGHHRRELGDLGENNNTWRQNVPWVFTNHHNPIILTVNCGLPNNWVRCNGDLECIGYVGEPQQGGKTLSISVVGDGRCAP